MERWYIGSMNDGLFIINTPPRPSNDYPWHDRPDGPTMVLAVSGLSLVRVQEIVDAHNLCLALEPVARHVDVDALNRELCAKEGHVLGVVARPCLRCHEWFDPQYGKNMNEPPPGLLDSMAFRYRHDFGLLSDREKDSIRTTMRQLWEEVAGKGFYRQPSTKAGK